MGMIPEISPEKWRKFLRKASGFDPWLECAVACRESKASRKITLEKTIGNYEEMPLAA
jgi:hypothetical protein